MDMLRSDPRIWRPHLDDILVIFGFEVRRWQIGASGGSEAFWEPQLAQQVQTAVQCSPNSCPLQPS